MALEIVNSNSRYESLLRGDLSGEDVKLIFVEADSSEEESSSSSRLSDAAAAADVNDGRISSVESSNSRTNVKKKKRDGDDADEKRREISAHKAFLQSCGLIRAAFEEDRFAESTSGEIRILVPFGTFGAIDGLLQWCYDGKCHIEPMKKKTNFLVLEQYMKGIPALWTLADFVQCKDLCDAIIGMLQAGTLRSGASFAILVDEAMALGSNKILEAALNGLPLDIELREELEVWLDFGSSEMLHALAKCHRQLEGCKADGDEEDATFSSADAIICILGEYLAEMNRNDRAKMPPSLFARCLAEFPAGTVAEADYAAIVLAYIEDRVLAGTDLIESGVSTLLSSIDFSAISREALVRGFIPRVERMSPSYALTINDFIPVAATITARCCFSGAILGAEKGSCTVLSCGNLLSNISAWWLFPKYRCILDRDTGKVKTSRVNSVICPGCTIAGNDGYHTLNRTEIIEAEGGYVEFSEGNFPYLRTSPPRHHREDWNNRITLLDGNNKIERIHSYLERKCVKKDALKRWASSHCAEEETAISQRPKKRIRVESNGLLSKDVGLFVRILNQCLCIGQEGVIFVRVDSLDSSIESAIQAFVGQCGIGRESAIPETVGFYLPNPEGSLGRRLNKDSTWRELHFDLKGADDELIIAIRPQVGGKPVIRIYSDDDIDNMEICLELEDWSNVLTYPCAITKTVEKDDDLDGYTKLSWNVRVKSRDSRGDHSSTIEHKTNNDAMWRKYSYLFWEASTISGFRICTLNASCVRSDELANGILQDALIAQGLSIEEATEMATHWLPAMVRKEFVLVEFLQQEHLDRRAKLTISPAPNMVHRVFMLFHPTDTENFSKVPLVRSPPVNVPRVGYAVVEWGGMEC